MKMSLHLAIAAILLMPSYALAQPLADENEREFRSIIQEGSRHRERYDAIIEYAPLITFDSEVTDPGEVASAWQNCKMVTSGARAVAHARQMDAAFVAYPEGRFTTSEERASIAISLAIRGRDTNASLETSLYACMKDFFSITVKPFP